MRARVAVVGVFHETNVFSPIPTRWESFARRYRGEELAAAFAGTRTVVGGFLGGGRDHGWQVVPVYGAYATPAGTVTASAGEALLTALEQELAAADGVDAVLLELHGAMVAEGSPDIEEEVLTVIRQRWPDAPVACVLDLHANLGRPRLVAVEILTGYRTNPHVDTYERGVAAANQLAALLDSGEPPCRAYRGIPVIAPPVGQSTAAPPLRDLEARARELERELGLDDVTVHAGFAYADVPHLGMGFSATARPTRAESAEEAVELLAALAQQRRSGFDRTLLTAAEAFRRAAAVPGCVAVADTGDNINGGAPGDGTWLLHEASAEPEVRTLATVWDPAALATATDAGFGATTPIRLGGHAAPSSGRPLETEMEVLLLGDGTFTNTGPMATGARVSMGAAAVVRHGALDVVIQQQPVQPNDPELFRSLGLAPEEYDVVLLKGAAAVRAGWAGVAADVVDAATPGVTDSDLSRLQFRKAPADLVRTGKRSTGLDVEGATK